MMLPGRPPPRPLTVAAVLLAVVALTVLHLQSPAMLGHRAPLMPFVLVVTLAAWYGGLSHGLLATAAGALASGYLFFGPVGQVRPQYGADGALLLLFVLAGTLISIVCEQLARARRMAEQERERALDQAAGLARQVEEKATLEGRLRERTRLLEELMDATPAAIYVKDPAGRLLLANRYLCELAGLPAAQVLGRRHFELFRLAPGDAIGAHDRRVLAGEQRQVFEETLQFPEGDRSFLSIKVPLQNEGLGGRVLCGVSIDITERKQAELALRDSDRRKDRFLAVLSHELRNPLNPIINATAVLAAARSRPEAAAQGEWARQVIERQVRQMARLLDDLLDIARITRDRLELRRAPLELRRAVELAVEASRPLIEQHRHRLQVECADEPLRIDGDLARVAQVISNLLNNAARYTPAGGRIELRLARRGSEALIEVSDNGVGIRREDFGKLFEMFSQVAPADELPQTGFGIGLALVHELVRRHDGRVAVDSAGRGQGSRFSVRLPLLPAPAPEGAAAAPRGAQPGAAALRVLVADDNADATETLATMLQLDGHQIATAHDGVAALEAARRFRPEVAVLDIGMPGLDGCEVAQALRAEPWGGRLLLIALTGWGQAEDRGRVQQAGFDYHLTKPLDPAVLRELLARRAPQPA